MDGERHCVGARGHRLMFDSLARNMLHSAQIGVAMLEIPRPLMSQSYEIVGGDEVGQWVADRACDGKYSAPLSEAIGLMRGERIIAGAIFNNWNQSSVQLHMAIERLNRDFLALLAWYAFEQLNVTKVIAPVSSQNIKSQRAVCHAGFNLEAVITDAHPDGDLMFFTMTAMQCPFLTNHYSSRLESYYGR